MAEWALLSVQRMPFLHNRRTTVVRLSMTLPKPSYEGPDRQERGDAQIHGQSQRQRCMLRPQAVQEVGIEPAQGTFETGKTSSQHPRPFAAGSLSTPGLSGASASSDPRGRAAPSNESNAGPFHLRSETRQTGVVAMYPSIGSLRVRNAGEKCHSAFPILQPAPPIAPWATPCSTVKKETKAASCSATEASPASKRQLNWKHTCRGVLS